MLVCCGVAQLAGVCQVRTAKNDEVRARAAQTLAESAWIVGVSTGNRAWLLRIA